MHLIEIGVLTDTPKVIGVCLCSRVAVRAEIVQVPSKDVLKRGAYDDTDEGKDRCGHPYRLPVQHNYYSVVK